MGNVPSKPFTNSTFSSSSSIVSPPSSPKARRGFNTMTGATLSIPQSTPPPRSSFSVESSTPKVKVQIHKRSHSANVRPPVSRSQNSDSGNSTGRSQHDLVFDIDNTNNISRTGTNTNLPENKGATTASGTSDLKAARAEISNSSVTFSGPLSLQLNKSLPSTPSILLPPALPEKDTPPGRRVVSPSPSLKAPTSSTTPQSVLENIHSSNTNPTIMDRTSSINSQSSLSDKSIISNSSSGNGSGGSIHTTTTPATSVTGGTTESLGLQRFPSGESEFNNNKKKVSSNSFRQSQDGQIKASRTTSTVSSSSARSSSGNNSGFKFSKPNLTFKPLLYSQGNDSRTQQQQQNIYRHISHNTSYSTPNGQQYVPDSSFPSILLSIKLPQSLLNKYVIDQEGFRQGKGIWGIGRYSWTITVISKTNGKKYVIKRVSKALLPPSAYYHYPTTAHQLCTCPACKASRDHLLMTGQLEDHELEKIKEVLVIQNRGKKELPQLPPSSPPQQHQKLQSQRPLSASSISPPPSKETKEKRRSFNMYSTFNASMPNHHGKFLSLSPNSSPHNTPVNSRPSTPSPSPLRLFASSSSPTAIGPAQKSHNRSHSQSNPLPQSAQSPSSNAHSPLLPSATPLSWPHKDNNESKDHSSGITFARPPVATRSSHTNHNLKKRPTLKKHASMPNISRPATGLDALEDDPSRLDQLKQLSRLNKNGWHPQDSKNRHHLYQKDTHPSEYEAERRLFDTPLTVTSTAPSFQSMTKSTDQDSDSEEDTYKQIQCKISMGIERKVNPFDVNGGEFHSMEPVPTKSKPSEPLGFVPPPHALPMELVLLQTYNDSDHLPEHHEWTQDKDYWYYVTKSHGVRRRKLKKVSTWWLDVGSLGSAFSSGSSSSHEPIATKPIYNMGHHTGDSTPALSDSPLSSELALSNGDASSTKGQGQATNGRHTPKLSVSSTANHEYTTPIGGSLKKQSSPRNSSHMGKYFYVDWDEYTSL